MSSLNRKFQGRPAVYVVQSGIVPWEDPDPIADWTSKTVTVCATDRALLTAVLKDVLGAEFGEQGRVFRCHVNPIPPSQNALQRRRLDKALHSDVPGFIRTTVRWADTVALSVAEAYRLIDIDLAYLSSHRQTFLIATHDAGLTTTTVAELLMPISVPVGGKVISSIRRKRETFVIIRILEDESRYVFQVICDLATGERVAQLIDALGLGRASDRVAAFQALVPRIGD